MRRLLNTAAPLLVAAALAGCQDEIPTSVDGGLIPLEPVSFEVRIPWDGFGSGLRVLGGFGAPSEVGSGLLANDFEGVLDARTLVRFTAIPVTATVTDTTGTSRPDTALTLLRGRIVAVVDTLTSRGRGPVTVGAGALLTPWHAPSATWRFAVDTLNGQEPWPIPGGGRMGPLGSGVWDAASGDSVTIPLDSATLETLRDTAAVNRGVRLELETEGGARLELRTAFLRVEARPSIRPDTIITVTAAPTALTFIHDPLPAPPPEGIRLGGVPAWRTVFRMDVPEALTGPPEVCQRVGCPIALTPSRVSHAALVLHTRASDPAFRPGDTVRVDLRPVLAPERLPKAPLGPSLVGPFGERVVARAFAETPGRKVEIGITAFVRDLLQRAEEEGEEPSRTLALLSLLEPDEIGFASFAGPGAEGEPYLRLVITISDRVQVR